MAVSRRHASQPLLGALSVAFLLLLALPAIQPFFAHGLPQAFDSGIHFARLGVLDYSVRQGELFPRWVPELQLGYGYPVFNFYAPGAYYVGALLLALGFNPYTAMVYAFVLAIWFAAVGMYLWAKDVYGEHGDWPALISGVAYAYAPYLLLNVYIRGAVAEAWAQSLIPWVFWSFRRLITSQLPMRRLPLAALTLGALALTHNITLMFVAPLLLVYVATIAWGKPRRIAGIRTASFAILFAMGISSFFWLPMILERRHLTTAGIEIARGGWLPANVWQWNNFLDWSLPYRYTFERPVRLGIWQPVLAIAGLVLARRSRREMWLLAIVVLGLGLGAGAWALSIWQSWDILTLVQFPWRLLVLISPVLALLTGGVVCRLPSGRRSSIVAVVIALGIVIAHSPRLGAINVFSAESVDISLPHVSQIEKFKGAEEGGEGTSSIQEFRPRWADRGLVLEPVQASTVLPSRITIQRAGPFGIDFTLAAPASTTLRFTNFFFPGWKFRSDASQSDVPLYPSTNLGIASVEIPAGEHQYKLTWEGTQTQRLASLLSLAAVLALAGFSWKFARHKGLALTLLAVSTLGAQQMLHSAPLKTIEAPAEVLETDSLSLLGYRYEQDSPGRLYIFPYWFVGQLQDENLRIRWALYDDAGLRLAEYASLPWFNSYRASNWPPGTIVDDAYSFPLPPRLGAGTYRLAAQIDSPASNTGSDFSRIGEITIRRPVPQQPSPAAKVAATYDDRFRLEGYDLSVPFRESPPHAADAAVRSGQTVVYELFWQATDTPSENVHGFIHLVGVDGVPIAQVDQLPGPFFQPPMLWNSTQLAPDFYRLQVPGSTPSGLYYPYTGLYRFAQKQRLPAYTLDGVPIGDQVVLPPIKVLGASPGTPTFDVEFNIGGFAKFLGYSTAPPILEVRPGNAITVTLYYESLSSTDRTYTRFLHMVQDDLRMAAQQDGFPSAGSNPTDAWIPGEVIADAVELKLLDDLAPGIYHLYMGFYDPDTPSSRLPLGSSDSKIQIQDDRARIGAIEIPKN